MKNLLAISFFLFLISTTWAQVQSNYSETEMVVKLNHNEQKSPSKIIKDLEFGMADLDLLNQQNKLTRISTLRQGEDVRTFVLQFDQPIDVPKLIDEYSAMGIFEYVEPNFIGFAGGKKGTIEFFPDDDLFSRQYGLFNDGSFGLSPAEEDADIDMELAWDIEQGSEDIIVAVLDSGVKLSHPEFAGRAWINTDESDNGTDSDNNGFIDDINGWNFADDNYNPIDDVGHGTNVAGIIAANGNNGVGYAGVDWNCKIMNCKVLDDSNLGWYTWFASGIYYAVDNGADVINMSLGGISFSQSMLDAVNYAYDHGVAIVACMMNFNSDDPYYPAAYEHTIAVGSTDANDHRTEPFFWDDESGSSYGSHIDLVAPGNYIYGLHNVFNNNYETYWGGTSQAAPLVTGICALLLSQDRDRTIDDLRSIITDTAEDQVGDLNSDTPGWDEYYGHGRLNAFDALNKGLSTSIESVEEETFSFYPNPSNGIISINVPESAKSIEVYSFDGRSIFTDKLSGMDSEYLLNLEEVKTQLVIIKILDRDKLTIKTEKVFIH